MVSRYAQTALCLLAGFFVHGCTTYLIRDRTIYQTSPDNKMKIVVATVGIKPQLRVFLEHESSRRTLFSDTDEWYMRFAKLYWSADSKICGVYVSGLSRTLLLAFDARTGVPIDAESVRSKIRDAIVDKYDLRDRIRANPSFDVFDWTGTQEAVNAFAEIGSEQRQ